MSDGIPREIVNRSPMELRGHVGETASAKLTAPHTTVRREVDQAETSRFSKLPSPSPSLASCQCISNFIGFAPVNHRPHWLHAYTLTEENGFGNGTAHYETHGQRRSYYIGAFDGRVATYFVVGHALYFVTTNTRYVPFMPPTGPKKIMVQRDMRYGPDDPVLWPQLYTDTFCHLAAIPKAPTSAQGQQKFGTLHLSLEHLRIPTTYIRMRLGVISVQREYFELTGLLQYMTKYKPRMEGIKDLNAHTTYPNDCLSCFTQDPRIAQAFWHACLPCWFLRPLQVFSDENILRVVALFVAAGDESSCWNTLWYRNPFAAASPNIASTSFTGSPDVASASVAGGWAEVPSRKVSCRDRRAKAKKEAQGPNLNTKVARDKFLPFQRPEMPTLITPWADALKAIDRGHPPSCSIDLPQRYVLPEPALVASPDEEPCCHMFYALMFHLADPNWRDVLQGKVVKQGKTGTRMQAHSTGLEELLWPAFQACGIDVLTEFLVLLEAVPTMCMHTVKELLWELAEINFRYEFLALDVFCGRGTDWAGFPQKPTGGNGPPALSPLSSRSHVKLEIDTAKEHTESEWDGSTVRQLEWKVTQYYTQSFYELFGRAAVVCMHLEHEIGS
ncbi:hypothetical protein B0H10DRAFT_1944803 [Mycena sp. CBHHK59/15]|nr:hypothetical protein B0H10DRAFT_1944803 [Mycena sp. CBHHK59/15]